MVHCGPAESKASALGNTMWACDGMHHEGLPYIVNRAMQVVSWESVQRAIIEGGIVHDRWLAEQMANSVDLFICIDESWAFLLGNGGRLEDVGGHHDPTQMLYMW